MKSPSTEIAGRPFDRVTLIRRYAFGGGFHVEIVRQRDGRYTAVELPTEGIRPSAVNPPRDLSPETVSALASILAAIRIPLVAPQVWGLDGWTSTLTVKVGFNELVAEWWCEGQGGWSVLETAAEEICRVTGCERRQMHPEDLRQQREKAQAESEARLLARREDYRQRLEATRSKAIRMGLATRENVDKVLFEMGAEQFRQHFAEFRVSRVLFKS